MPSVQKLYVFTNVIKETQFFQDHVFSLKCLR